MAKERMALQEKLAKRNLKRPPVLIYIILGFLWRILFKRRLNVHYEYKVDLRQFRKTPYIVVSNHTSRLDYLFAGLAFYPHRLNYVAGYNEFFRSHLAFVFRLLQAIPKRNFTRDVYTVKEFTSIINQGGKVIIFPEGEDSIGGANQPCALGSGYLLKHYKVPVLMTMISGGYLTSTKYCLDERHGRVDVVVSQLFTPEDLERMTSDEIQAKLDEAISHDDYEWNKAARVKFTGKGRMAHNMQQLLYWCPKCHGEFTMKGEGDTITCSKCGNGATVNEYYDLVPFDSTCVIPETPRVWYDMERKDVYRQILDEKFELQEKVRMGSLLKYEYLKHKKTSEIVGEGELILNRQGLTYEGTRDGQPFTFHLNSNQVPTYGTCTDASCFFTYYKGEFFEFFPAREATTKILFATEEIHRINGGRWKNFPDATTYDEA